MIVWEVAAGVVVGWLVLCALILAVIVAAGRGSMLVRGSCSVCGWRGDRADLLVHGEMSHRG